MCSTSRTINDEDVITEHLTASGVVCHRPGWLLSAIFSSTMVVPVLGRLFDGESVLDKKLLQVDFTDRRSVPIILEGPMRFNKVLFLALTPGITCAVQYVPGY